MRGRSSGSLWRSPTLPTLRGAGSTGYGTRGSDARARSGLPGMADGQRIDSGSDAPDRTRVPDETVHPGRHRARRADARCRAGHRRARRRERRRQVAPSSGSSSASCRRRRVRRRVLGARRRDRWHPHPRARRLHARARLPAERRLRHRLRHPHGPDVAACPAPRPASGRPTSCATSASSRSATGRSAATRRA